MSNESPLHGLEIPGRIAELLYKSPELVRICAVIAAAAKQHKARQVLSAVRSETADIRTQLALPPCNLVHDSEAGRAMIAQLNRVDALLALEVTGDFVQNER